MGCPCGPVVPEPSPPATADGPSSLSWTRFSPTEIQKGTWHPPHPLSLLEYAPLTGGPLLSCHPLVQPHCPHCPPHSVLPLRLEDASRVTRPRGRQPVPWGQALSSVVRPPTRATLEEPRITQPHCRIASGASSSLALGAEVMGGSLGAGELCAARTLGRSPCRSGRRD